jgi:hypothetical protein
MIRCSPKKWRGRVYRTLSRASQFRVVSFVSLSQRGSKPAATKAAQG